VATLLETLEGMAFLESRSVWYYVLHLRNSVICYA